MSESTKTELFNTRRLSRFVERFDFSPPPELLEEEEIPFLSLSVSSSTTRPSRLIIQDPLLAIQHHSNNDNILTPTSPPRLQVPVQSFSATKAKSSQPLTNQQASTTTTTNNRHTFPPSLQQAHRLNSNITPHEEQPYCNQPKATRKHSHRADLIIRRYDSWIQFLSLLVLWINELVKATTQSERTLSLFLREPRFSDTNGNDIKSANEIHALLYGFTTDLASQEQRFVQILQKQIPVLERLKRECSGNRKALKARSDLFQDEFLKRAEVTANYISQLTRVCKEAHRTVQKNGQLTTDPWLVNVYVVRQLKKEVDEDNRLRKLMVPIQQKSKDFEQRLLKAVDDTLQACFHLPNCDKVETARRIQDAVGCHWESFVAANEKTFVDEEKPEKNYLQINYACKYNPFVMTLHKGQLERRTGVLNKYSTKFFVLTESGFLHQFRLNDKVSPEHTIYIPNATIVPCLDISNLNLKKPLRVQVETQKQKKRDTTTTFYTFEIRRSGSVLQRDKSYSFRSSSLEEMIVWCKLLQNIATRPYDTTATLLPSENASHSANTFLDKTQESTPPPSPMKLQQSDRDISSQKVLLDSRLSDQNIETIEHNNGGRCDVYTPKLNI